ncbi:PepSY domain-containing protein [Paenibacillaceae bacterium WGS1546]|uniref:PepSY domain-containing protein n=1 Tax=Cohnella sp. WGS1546 TaxID=3366810 RepID=UPI00372D361F
MNRRWAWLAGGAVAALAAIGIVFLGKPWEPEPQALSGEDLQQAVLARYPGQIEEIAREDRLYVLRLQTDKGLYEVKADAVSGDIVYLNRIGTADDDVPTPPPVETGGSPSPSAPGSGDGESVSGEKPPSALIGADRAMAIAAAHVQGEAEDIELKSSASDGIYYLVEVDVEHGEDAIVQVNAVSGAIMSVLWDVDDDDDD